MMDSKWDEMQEVIHQEHFGGGYNLEEFQARQAILFELKYW
jgi:hypothetical protein